MQVLMHRHVASPDQSWLCDEMRCWYPRVSKPLPVAMRKPIRESFGIFRKITGICFRLVPSERSDDEVTIEFQVYRGRFARGGRIVIC
jgi:hypothetical protein